MQQQAPTVQAGAQPGQSGMCGCNSGLRAQSCCAQQRLMRLPQETAVQFRPQVEQAEKALNDGDIQGASYFCLQVLETAPGHFAALVVLYQIRLREHKPRAAEALIRRIVALDPNNLWAANELAQMLYRNGKRGEAEIHARNAIRLGPEDAQAHATMGMILTDGNRNKPGEHHYRQAIKFTKDNPRLLANLAQNLKSQGRLEEAEDCFRRALEGEPKNVQTLLGWAKMEESRRNFEKAWELTDQAADLAPDLPTVVIQRATLFSREKKHEDALEVLERFSAERADSAATDQGDVPGLLMEKGQVLDRLGRYDDAFLAFSEAKKRLRETSGTQYMAQAAQEQAARLKAFFVRGRMSLLTPARKAEGRVQPLFITGFPRSGTTMTEQILSAHPNISAGDELPFLGDMTRFTQRMLGAPLAYPEALADLWMGDNQGAAELLRDHYLLKVDQLEIVEDGTDWFTDKMPLNEWQMGLMALLFPESPVVHLQRHPLDQVLSCFSNFLTHGFYCAYDLVTAAQHVALTADLVEHFVDELPLKHKIVRYEDIVSDQETHVRALLEFVDEPFDERCLNFHENKRFARTASYAQVTEPLYTGSRFRYRNYRKQLEPALAVLEPTIRRLGYPVD